MLIDTEPLPIKNRVYLAESEIEAFHEAGAVQPPVAYTLRAPMGQVLLVTRKPQGGAVSVRATQFNPLTWQPFSMSVNIPEHDSDAAANLVEPGAQCVLALPSRHLLRQLTICWQQFPRGISEADVARFRLCKSEHVDVPSIDDCPVNLECEVAHVERYHAHVIAFLRCVGANIDMGTLFMPHDKALGLYPTYLVDETADASGVLRRRVGLQTEFFDCPTFPVGPKRGWYANFGIWMRELADEGYLEAAEFELVLKWEERWLKIFEDLESTERAVLRVRLTEMLRLIARERWGELHSFMTNEGLAR